MENKLVSPNDLAISVKNITKIYKLYNTPKDRLREALNPFRKKYHRSFHALKNVSFEVKKGEILGIVGRNGAGKSTLLEIITGVLSQASGAVKTNGKISALLSLGIGFNPELTGVENIRFNGALQGYSKNELDARVEDILNFAEIEEFAYQPIKTYSSGMQARLGFAVSINIDPDILIVDEALAVGDELFRRKCYAILEKLMKAGKTILFVTHSINIVTQLCTRAILIDKGELLLEGTPKFVTTHYQKYLFAKKEDQEKVRDEILILNGKEKLKKTIDEDVENQDEKNIGKSNFNKSIKQDPFFVKNYISKSKVEYRNEDVDIYDMAMRTLQGVKVNHLVHNEEYIYSFNVKFNINSKNVFFGSRFKNDKGIRISGLRTDKSRQMIKEVKKGDVFNIKYKFNCTLLHGIYTTDTSVNFFLDEELKSLNRIDDCFIFRVQKKSDVPVNGIVSLQQEVSFTKLGDK